MVDVMSPAQINATFAALNLPYAAPQPKDQHKNVTTVPFIQPEGNVVRRVSLSNGTGQMLNNKTNAKLERRS